MASAPLMVTISGVRGIAGQSLLPLTIIKFVTAFGVLLQQKYPNNRKIIIGRDSRVSGPWVTKIAVGTLLSLGAELIDLNIVPTPTVQYMVIKQKAAGGLIITSSHNPIEWNGLKFVDSDGLFFDPDMCKEMFTLADKIEKNEFVVNYPHWDKVKTHVTEINDAGQQHIDAIFSLKYINVKQIRERKFKVVLDTVNGAGGPIMLQLLMQLGCQIIGLNLDPSGVFPRPPEPIPENLTQLCEAVKRENADLGIAVDPDVDRCVVIDETGNPLGEEYTLALAVEFILGKCNLRGPVCKNLSTTIAVDDIAAKYNCPLIATAVGEINVAKVMKERGSVIGGEGNGGVMLPDIHIGRDAPVAATLILQLLSLFSGPISALKKTLPLYEIVKLKISIEGIDADTVIDQIKKEWVNNKNAKIDTQDGLHIKFVNGTEKWWVHLRKSNTEPIIRVIGEAGNFKESTELCQKFLVQIKSLAAAYKK